MRRERATQERTSDAIQRRRRDGIGPFVLRPASPAPAPSEVGAGYVFKQGEIITRGWLVPCSTDFWRFVPDEEVRNALASNCLTANPSFFTEVFLASQQRTHLTIPVPASPRVFTFWGQRLAIFLAGLREVSVYKSQTNPNWLIVLARYHSPSLKIIRKVLTSLASLKAKVVAVWRYHKTVRIYGVVPQDFSVHFCFTSAEDDLASASCVIQAGKRAPPEFERPADVAPPSSVWIAPAVMRPSAPPALPLAEGDAVVVA
ncbi:MAG: hypothetical protein SLRJCFUN_001571 [Candidatus Fervidibacter sp.]|jgi:hypothetical protein